MPDSLPRAGLIISRTRPARGQLISFGESSAQCSAHGLTISVGTASGNVISALSPAGVPPTVDHFRPLSRFPRLAYEWSNWIFSCQRCNHNKANKWPDLGYVDPCAADASDRPDRYFDYDMLTGDIVPKRSLPSAAQRRAWDTIDDLGLNKLDVKIHRLECIQEFWNGVTSQQFSYRQTFITLFTEQPVEYAGAIGMLVEQLRQAGRI